MQRERPSSGWGSKQFKGQPSSEQKANKIIKECIDQNQIFRERQTSRNWRAIHEAHYDWWAFPINQPSSYGREYMVFETQVQIMKRDPLFMAALKSNAIIVCKAWGWNLVKGEEILTDHKDQRWHNWPIRLYKMARSLQIFQATPLFQHAVQYAIKIMTESGKHLQYGKRDISAYFTAKWSQIKKDSPKREAFIQKPIQTKSQINYKRPQSLLQKSINEKSQFEQKPNKFSLRNFGQKKQINIYGSLYGKQSYAFRK